jgi:hypothetical protein
MNPGNIQQPTSNAQHPLIARLAGIGCSMLDVGYWMFSPLGSGVQSANTRIRRILSQPSGLALLLGQHALPSAAAGTKKKPPFRAASVNC